MTDDREGARLGCRSSPHATGTGLELRLAKADETAAGWRLLPPPPVGPGGR